MELEGCYAPSLGMELEGYYAPSLGMDPGGAGSGSFWWAVAATVLAIAASWVVLVQLTAQAARGKARLAKVLAGKSILEARERSDILARAATDGSSVVCSKCGDLVAKERWTPHVTMWCRAVGDDALLERWEVSHEATVSAGGGTGNGSTAGTPSALSHGCNRDNEPEMPRMDASTAAGTGTHAAMPFLWDRQGDVD